jgi:hypothetical protein
MSNYKLTIVFMIDGKSIVYEEITLRSCYLYLIEEN